MSQNFDPTAPKRHPFLLSSMHYNTTFPTRRQAIVFWSVIFACALALQLGLTFGLENQGISYHVTTWLLALLATVIFVPPLIMTRRNGTYAERDINEEESPGAASKPENEEDPEQPATEPTSRAKTKPDNDRLYFLDHAKVFLMFLVVTHHICIAFGAEGGWWLVIGAYKNPLAKVLSIVCLLDQAYFMPLFLFVSAYFSPGSFKKRDKDTMRFLRGKSVRIYLPAMITIFTIVPFTSMISRAAAGSFSSTQYIPSIGQCWFLFWLLLLNFVYTTFPSNESGNLQLTSPPTWCHRVLYGTLVCGLAMLGIYMAMDGWPFYGMPVAIGSVTCDFLLFTTGVYAYSHEWLSLSIRERLLHSRSIWLLRVLVLFEAIVMVISWMYLEDTDNMTGIVLFLAAGLFCIDISIAAVQFFQQITDTQTKLLKFLSEAAYTVYLIHPIVVVSVTAVFVKAYNAIFDREVIQFDANSMRSESVLEGPGDGILHLFIGFVIVSVVTHLIVWPLSWFVRRLPLLRLML